MRFHREARRILAIPAIGLAIVAATAACSSGGGNSGSKATASASASSSSASASASASSGNSSAAVAAIKANWAKFISGSSSTSERVSVLENGQKFSSLISAMSALGKTAAAKVTNVQMTSPKQATVTYTVYLGGKPALKNEKGVSVLENGTWKVTDASFCALLALQNGGKPPSICSSAS